MPNMLNIEIVDADKSLYSGEGTMVIATASEGEVGIMHGHTPFLSSLKPGYIIVKKSDESKENIFISGGFIEVQPHHVNILADDAERADDIDEAKAEKAKRDAENELRDATGPDFTKAQQALAEASARLSMIQRLRK